MCAKCWLDQHALPQKLPVKFSFIDVLYSKQFAKIVFNMMKISSLFGHQQEIPLPTILVFLQIPLPNILVFVQANQEDAFLDQS